ncbi:MAG: bifunctional nuclease domain-containing protein, partial [Mycobacterium sp.]
MALSGVGRCPGDSITDGELVGRARQGDKVAFGELVDRHWDLAVGVCSRLVRNPEAAAEVLQETAVIALVNLDRLVEPDRFGAWLCGIGLNVARGRIRQAREEPVACIGEEIADNVPDPAERAAASDIARRVRFAVSHLAPGQRDAIMLFYLRGLTHREVAAELGISVNAVKARLHQARASLEPQLMSLREGKEPVAMAFSTAWIDAEISEIRRGGEDHPSGAFGKPHVVVLRDAGSGRQLPLWIGAAEALALVTSIESVDMPRPMTYQFAANLLQATGASVSEVRI